MEWYLYRIFDYTPEDVKGDTGKPDENVEKKILDQAKKGGLNIEASDIDKCHRKGKPADNYNRKNESNPLQENEDNKFGNGTVEKARLKPLDYEKQIQSKTKKKSLLQMEKSEIAEPFKSESNHLAVCAIDFGTSFTGIAYSLSCDYKNVEILTKSSNRAYGEKVPTALLLTKDKQFFKFGFEAEEEYDQICAEERGEDFYYFNCFKMKLYGEKKLTTEVEISDVRGRKLPALDLFAMTIKHLIDYVEEIGKTQCAGVVFDDFLWVLTVPAIWSDSAKNFMRKAAEKAGIPSKHLKLCLEPEAASLWCNDLKSCKTALINGRVECQHFPEGQKYILADLGGGTADLSVHEILSDRSLREIRRADGGAFGGNLVDAAFFRLLEDIFGVNVMAHIEETAFGVIMSLKYHFQIKKHSYNPEGNGESKSINIDLPAIDLEEAIRNIGESSLEEKINLAREKYKGKISFLNTRKLILHSIIMEEFFDKALEGIVDVICDMRKDHEFGEINMIMLVGGFSSSLYIQRCIKERVPGLRIFVPYDPSLAVLKGAVLMGHKPKSITQKIARYTYGFSVMKAFREGIDPKKFRVFKNGKNMCSSTFSKIVEKGTIYKPGDEFGETLLKHEITNSEKISAAAKINVIRSEDTNPEYAVEEYGCEVGATIIIPPPNGKWPSVTMFILKMVLGLSELTVNVYNTNNKKIEAKLEFL